MSTIKESEAEVKKYCDHQLVAVKECTLCGKTFDVLPSENECWAGFYAVCEKIKLGTDTPQEAACPHCGAARNFHSIIYWECHSSLTQRSALCIARERAHKAEAEVKELKLELAVSLKNQVKAMQEVERLRKYVAILEIYSPENEHSLPEWRSIIGSKEEFEDPIVLFYLYKFRITPKEVYKLSGISE
jgi:hypothetical protein